MKNASMGTIAFLLCLLLLSADPSQAQIARENPGNLTQIPPFSAWKLSAMQSGDPFLSMDSIVESLGSSDFDVSRERLNNVLNTYSHFGDLVKESDLSDEETQLILDRLGMTADDVNALINSSEAYDRDYSDFNTYMAAGDSGNATQTAARLQSHYADLSSTARGITDNATYIMNNLSDAGANTSDIESFLASMSNYTSRIASNNQLPYSMANDPGLLLSCDRDEATSGDMLPLTAKLSATNGSVASRTVDFYADNVKIGRGITDQSGLCAFDYTVGVPLLNGPLRLSASLSPQAGLPALTSNIVEVQRLPEQASLQITAASDQIKFGDRTTIHGSFVTATGYPVPRRNVSIWFGNLSIGSAVTGSDGSFAYLLDITGDMPSGQVPLTARYDQKPGDAAIPSITSNTIILNIRQDSTRLTLNPPESSYSGGSTDLLNGTLATGSGRPVSGANIGIYANGSLIGRGNTDRNGTYGIALTVPYDLPRGNYSLYAAYRPGEGRALAGAEGPVYPAVLEPGAPAISIRGSPALIFPGDRLAVDGLLTVDGVPLSDRAVNLTMSGEVLATAVTDAYGRFRLSSEAALSPGVYTLSVRSAEDRLIAASEQATWPFVAMPFDLRASLIIGALILTGILAVAKIRGVDRIIFRRKPREEALAPDLVSSSGMGEAALREEAALPEESLLPSMSFEEEIASIDRFIASGGKARDSITNIYMAVRNVALRHGLRIDRSDTHRDLARKMSDRDPSLDASLNTILFYYENAVFGHYLPGRQDIINSLYCLQEIQAAMAGGEGQ
jgi:hypothetical protein